MKKIISIICIISVLMTFMIPNTLADGLLFNDLSSSDDCYRAVVRLSDLGIVNGYEDGTYKKNNNVTRAEFCKIIVAMMDKVTQAKSTPPASSFDDVNKVKWCIPYVNYLTSQGVIKGYANATFKPNNVITYAEAVTIICRTLGYSEDVVGYSWPSNYLNEAEALGLTDEKLSKDSPVTRGTMAKIVDNALFSNVCGKNITFLESIGYSVLKNSHITATGESDLSLDRDEIKTNSGTYTCVNQSILSKSGLMGMLILNDEKEAVSFKEENASVVVKATRNYTASDTLLEGIQINFDRLKIYKNNKTVSLGEIKANDVIYYNTKTNIMDVYDKKVTGIYTEAIPSKAYVTSVSVGGNVYNINPTVSTSKLDASQGSYELGERITLLLGKNDEVCFVTQSSGFDKFSYGVLLQTYKETAQSGKNEGMTVRMASLFMPDGNTYKYSIEEDYEKYVGELVKIDYYEDRVQLSTAESSDVYGNINKKERKIGNASVLDDVAVIHRLSDENASQVQVELLDFDTMDLSDISKSQHITSISTNSFGDIAILYLCDVATGYQYGLCKGSENNSVGDNISMTYKIYNNSNLYEYQTDVRYSMTADGVKYKVVGGKLSQMSQLYTIARNKKLVAAESGRIKIGTSIYTMSDDVQIIDTTDYSNYRTITIDELSRRTGANITLYSDKSISDGPIIRIVRVGN